MRTSKNQSLRRILMGLSAGFLLAVAFVALGSIPLTAWATQIVSRGKSTVPAILSCSGSGATINGGNVVTVRDLNNAVIANAYVTFDFTGTGMTPYASQPSGITPEAAFCNLLTVRTDSSGTVNFVPRMSGFENDTTIVVYARVALCDTAVVLKRVRGRSTDIVTSVAIGNRWGTPENTGLADYSAFTAAYQTTHAQECDFDRNGSVGLGDWSIFSQEYLIEYTALLCVP